MGLLVVFSVCFVVLWVCVVVVMLVVVACCHLGRALLLSC